MNAKAVAAILSLKTDDEIKSDLSKYLRAEARQIVEELRKTGRVK